MFWEWKIIETYNDLPEYGKYVMVLGKDIRIYNKETYHICCIDDNEDGYEFNKTGYFNWLREDGVKIHDVKYWCDIPMFIEPKIYKRIQKINKIKKNYGYKI